MCQDTNSDVRISMCQQLGAIARAIRFIRLISILTNDFIYKCLLYFHGFIIQLFFFTQNHGFSFSISLYSPELLRSELLQELYTLLDDEGVRVKMAAFESLVRFCTHLYFPNFFLNFIFNYLLQVDMLDIFDRNLRKEQVIPILYRFCNEVCDLYCVYLPLIEF